MRKQIISNKSFERTSKRFLKLALVTIDNFSDDVSFKDRYDIDDKNWYNFVRDLSKLDKNYKLKPFKKKSSYTYKINSFETIDIVNRYLRVQYIKDSNLVFKLLTKTKSRYKRKCQLVLKIK